MGCNQEFWELIMDITKKREELLNIIANFICVFDTGYDLNEVSEAERVYYWDRAIALAKELEPCVVIADESEELPKLPVIAEKGFESHWDWKKRRAGYQMARRDAVKAGFKRVYPLKE
jgi:hypothetical protein